MVRDDLVPRRRWWMVALGPALGALVLLLQPGGGGAVSSMAAIATWMATWWITEAVPIPVTSLLPLVLLPVAGVLPVREVAPNYGRPEVYLFLGGFLIALGLQASGAHRRVALGIVHRVGSRPRRLVLGLMLATWALSMWISNTSTAMLMLPIALALFQTARDAGTPDAELRQLAVAALLGVAYAANMGGMATIVGTPPNLVFSRLFVQLFPDAPPIGFLDWMIMAGPFSVAFLVLGWLLLTRVVFRLPDRELLGGRETVAGLRDGLGPVRRDERLAFAVFGVTAVLWMTGAGVTLGSTHVPGWRELLGLEGMVDDAAVAVAMAVVLFLLPSADRPGERLLEWNMTRDVPWGVLLLFGGGFALAAGFTSSGLSAWASSRFELLAGAPPWVVVIVVAVLMTFLTELTSNTATTQLALPILASAARTLELDPRALMITATLSASCAFMMPVATPPAAIVFGSGYVPIRQMVRAGLWFNLLGAILVLLTMRFLADPLLGVDLHVLPPWAGP